MNQNDDADSGGNNRDASQRPGRQLGPVTRRNGLTRSVKPSSPGALHSMTPPPALSSGPDALSLLNAIKRRWFLAGSVGILLAAASLGGLLFVMPAKYQAFALLQVSANPSQLGSAGATRNDFQTYMKTQAGRLKSRDVQMKALAQDQVRNLRLVKSQPDILSTLTWLDENFKVDFQADSELLTPSLTGEDPNELVILVNAITRSYLNIVDAQEKAKRKDRVDKMRMLYQQTYEKLGEKVAARDALNKGQGTKDGISLSQKQTTLINQLSRAQEQLQLVQFELEKKQIQLA